MVSKLPAVVLSASTNIFTNLALEGWLYHNVNYEERGPQLLLWRNEPCVVIGRHQNPWLEVSLSTCQVLDASLARRDSGGGTVYHDLGNLNCTFFTSRNGYNRRRNLDMMCRALRRRWKLDVSVSDRENILLNGNYKVSGTAAKLGRSNAYHHCTLLLNSNKVALASSLRKNLEDSVDSKATRSVKSVVKNLTDIAPYANFVNVISEIGFEFRNRWNKLDENTLMIDPTDEDFPGLHDSATSLRSWDWIYGKTPQFSVKEQFSDPDGPLRKLILSVRGGRFESLSEDPVRTEGSHSCRYLEENLKGEKIHPSIISTAAGLMRSYGGIEEDIVATVRRFERMVSKLYM